MIIEDEQDILLLYKDYLISRGYKVIVSSNTGVDAISDYKTFLPDVAIIDYRLPNNENGLQIAKEILAVNENAAIVLVSAYESLKNIFHADDISNRKNVKLLIKPIKLSILEKTIHEVIDNKNPP